MNKYAFVLSTVMLLSCLGAGEILAQSKAQSGSSDSVPSQAAFTTEPIVLETPTGSLYGTLERPQSASPMPVVLVIAGSGPTDRDGNSPMLHGANDSLKLLANGLAARGIASVRYDKRGIGESGKAMLLAAKAGKAMLREEDLRFDTYIDDAVLWGKRLRSDSHFSSLTVVGHSEGSLIGMVAAQRMAADAFVSIAGAGRPAQVILLEQLKSQLPPDLMKSAEDILNQLAAGKTVASAPPALNALFRPSVQPYMVSWLRYDPAREIATLYIPVLIVQGTTDIQVGVGDAKLLANAKPSAKLSLINGMNHVFKAVSSDRDKQIASYGDPSLPVVPELISEISNFVLSLKAHHV